MIGMFTVGRYKKDWSDLSHVQPNFALVEILTYKKFKDSLTFHAHSDYVDPFLGGTRWSNPMLPIFVPDLELKKF